MNHYILGIQCFANADSGACIIKFSKKTKSEPIETVLNWTDSYITKNMKNPGLKVRKKSRPDGCRWTAEKGWLRDDDVKPHTTPTAKDMAPVERVYTKDDVVNKSNNNLVTFNNSEDAKKRWRATCKEYGFKDGTEEMGKCILRIQELEFEQMKLQIQINTANQQTIKETRAEQRAASQQRLHDLQQQKILEEQRYDRGLVQLQQAFGILNSLNPPKTTCTFNALMNNMVCR